ncbi:hypothetical protein ACHQM5_010256 [Ranunculus cassubicifolius]
MFDPSQFGSHSFGSLSTQASAPMSSPSIFGSSFPSGNTSTATSSTPAFGITNSSCIHQAPSCSGLPGPFRTSTTPRFVSSGTPAFGASGDLSLSFGTAQSNSAPVPSASIFGSGSSTPSSGSDFGAFGTLSLSFGSTSTSGQSNTTMLGAPSVLATCPAANPAFGAFGTLTLTFGPNPGQSNFVPRSSFCGTTSASGCAFNASGTLSLSFGSTPNLIQSNSTSRVGAEPSVFEAKTDNHVIQKSPFELQRPHGSRVANYKQTPETVEHDNVTEVASVYGSKLVSISAMPVYKDTSHEELRWGDYKLGDKGDSVPKHNLFSPSFIAKELPPFRVTRIGSKDGCGTYQIGASTSPFGAPFGASTSPFGASTSPFGAPFGASTSPFGASTSPSTSPFGASTSPFGAPFGASTSPSTSPFGASTSPSTSPFGASTSPFGASTSPFGAPFGASTSPFGASTSPSTSPFGASTSPSTSPFGASTSPFGAPFGASTSPFGASTSPFGAPFGASTSPFGASTSPFGASTSPFGAPFGASTSLFGASTSPSSEVKVPNSDGCSSSTFQIAGSSSTFSGPSAQPFVSACPLFVDGSNYESIMQTASSQITGGLSSSGDPKSES